MMLAVSQEGMIVDHGIECDGNGCRGVVTALEPVRAEQVRRPE